MRNRNSCSQFWKRLILYFIPRVYVAGGCIDKRGKIYDAIEDSFLPILTILELHPPFQNYILMLLVYDIFVPRPSFPRDTHEKPGITPTWILHTRCPP